jgi:hypothetical protein
MKGENINGEYYLNEMINVDKKELLNLQEDMKELRSLLETVARSTVKEIINHKFNVILVKMAGIAYDSLRNEEHNSCGTKVKKGRSKADRKHYSQYQIPVINNRCELLETCKIWNT